MKDLLSKNSSWLFKEHRSVVEVKTFMSLFQMVLLDVLIIGGGPHALTLASLLSSTEPVANCGSGHDLAPCASFSAPQSVVEQTGKKCTGHMKRKQQRPVAGKA